MIETIGLTLVKSLATFLFKTYLFAAPHVAIDGAPSWYMTNVKSQVCVYEHQTGGFDAVDIAKANSYPKMENEISNILESVIYQNFSNVKDPKERQFIFQFKTDPEGSIYVKGALKFVNIAYKKESHTAFVQACIPKDELIQYQTKRVEKIKYELSHKRSDDAFKELDGSVTEVE